MATGKHTEHDEMTPEEAQEIVAAINRNDDPSSDVSQLLRAAQVLYSDDPTSRDNLEWVKTLTAHAIKVINTGS